MVVVHGRFLVRTPTGGWSMDLPQNEDRERNLSIYWDDGKNPNQDFVLIPVDEDAWFICAKRTGAVLVATDGVTVGILSPEKLSNGSESHWILEKEEGGGSIKIKNKGFGKYLSLRESKPKAADDFVFSSQNKAASFVWQEIEEPIVYLRSQEENISTLSPPHPTSLEIGRYPKRTDAVCVGERLIPYFNVNDDVFYTTWAKKVEHQPVYRIRDFEYWQRYLGQVTDGQEKKEITVLQRDVESEFHVTKETYRKEERSDIENTERTNVDVNFGLASIGRVNVKEYVSIKTHKSTRTTVGMDTTNGTSGTRTDEVMEKVTLPATGKETLHVRWVKIHMMRLERIDPLKIEGRTVREISITEPETTVKYIFPDVQSK